MLYTASRVLPYSPAKVWRVLSDVRHYVHKDPFHSDLVFVSTQHEGVGTTFTMRHKYWPNFPFWPDMVSARISVSEPEREQVLVETNVRAYRNHVQRFVLEPVEGSEATKVTYLITYMGIPMWLYPWRAWVQWRVVRRMEEKLRDLEEQCGAV